MFALCGLGIVGEAGEVAELIKKHLFHGHLLDRDKVISELGDVLWYITVLAAELNVPLEVLFEHNISKLRKRYPSGFSPEASKNQEA
jgi:NTP pyrophosphatase (non-canonical NTP hydrolase)